MRICLADLERPKENQLEDLERCLRFLGGWELEPKDVEGCVKRDGDFGWSEGGSAGRGALEGPGTFRAEA